MSDGVIEDKEFFCPICEEVFHEDDQSMSEIESCFECVKNLPIYQHDCESCVYLAITKEQRETFDLYYCSQCNMPTIIARFGEDGDFVSSGLDFAKSAYEGAYNNKPHGSYTHAMGKGYAIALEKGLIKD